MAGAPSRDADKGLASEQRRPIIESIATVLASLYILPRYGGHVLERFHLFGHGRRDDE